MSDPIAPGRSRLVLPIRFFTCKRGEAAPKEEDPKANALAALEALFKK